MTGTAEVKPPQTNAQWARNTDRRIQSVEHPTSSRVGPWVLSNDDNTGNLIASNINGGSVIIAEPPPGGVDPDAISTTGQPFLRVARVNPQSIPVTTLTNITWDSVQISVGGWQFIASGTDLVVPRAGLYEVKLNIYSTVGISAQTAFAININGSAFTVREPGITETVMAAGISDVLRLGAGDVLNGQMLITSGSGYSIGVSPRGPNAYTSMTVTRLPVDL